MELWALAIIAGIGYLIWKSNSKEKKKMEYRKIVNFSKR